MDVIMIAIAVGIVSYLIIGCYIANELVMFPIGRWTPVLFVFVAVLWLPIVARMIYGSFFH